MPFNGAGAYAPPVGDFPAVSNTLIESAKFNNVINDVATALSACIVKDGQSTPSANLPMGGFKHTGVADGSARTHYASLGQIQDGAVGFSGNAGGTANALTLTPAIPILAYITGQQIIGKATATNTAAATLAVSGLAAKNIKRNGVTLVAGDLVNGGFYTFLYDGVDFQIFDESIPPWVTGDVRVTLRTAAQNGWVMFNDGTIGDAASGATTRANADTQALFTLLWTNTADAQCPVSGGRGGTAAADYAAHKTIGLPKVLGRELAVAGAGAGLTARVLAQVLGSEDSVVVTHTHGNGTLAMDAQGNHAHNVSLNKGGTGATFSSASTVGASLDGQNTDVLAQGALVNTGITDAAGNHVHNVTGAIANSGVSGVGANISPRVHFNVEVRL